MKPRNDRGTLVAQSSAINREIAGGGYVPWYWGISPGAVRAMLEAAGFAVVEEHRLACHMTVVARMA